MYALFTVRQPTETIDINSLNTKAMNDVFIDRGVDFGLVNKKGQVFFKVKLNNKLSIDQVIGLAKLYNQKSIIFINKKNNNEVIFI